MGLARVPVRTRRPAWGKGGGREREAEPTLKIPRRCLLSPRCASPSPFLPRLGDERRRRAAWPFLLFVLVLRFVAGHRDDEERADRGNGSSNSSSSSISGGSQHQHQQRGHRLPKGETGPRKYSLSSLRSTRSPRFPRPVSPASPSGVLLFADPLCRAKGDPLPDRLARADSP